MSLSFPSAPFTGQVYQGWLWNGQAWDPNFANSFVTSFNGRRGDVSMKIGDFPGVVDGSNAAPGQVGEFLTYYLSSAANATPGGAVNFNGITLPPGDWDLFTLATANSSNGMQRFSLSVSPVQENFSTPMSWIDWAGTGATMNVMSAAVLSRVNVTAPQVMTVAYFTATTVAFTAYFWQRARRMR